MQAAPGDIPEHCDSCGSVQLHRPDGRSVLHCLGCLTRPAPRRERDEAVTTTPLGEHVRNGLVAGVLAVICIVIWAQACSGLH